MSKETEYSDFILNTARQYDLYPSTVQEIWENYDEGWCDEFYAELEDFTKSLAERKRGREQIALIPALPFIEQVIRLMGKSVEDSMAIKDKDALLSLKVQAEYSMGISGWILALSKPFNPEQIPDILEGWTYDNGFQEWESSCMGTISIGRDNLIRFSPEVNGYCYDVPVTSSNLDTFLTDLKRSGITAHFRADWIKKMGLA